MRLQEIYYICRMTYEHWPEMNFQSFTLNGSTYFKLVNPQKIVATLDSLSKIEFTSEYIKKIYRVAVGFGSTTGLVNFNSTEKGHLVSIYAELKNRIGTIADFFESIGYQQDRLGFDIKLPPNITLSELGKCVKDLNTIFTQCPLLKSDEGSIEFKEVDVGSIWLGFGVAAGATAILSMLAVLIDKLVVVRSHWLNAKQLEEDVRRLDLGNELLDNYVKTHNTIQKKMLENVVADLSRDNNINSPEEQERLKYSLELLLEWQKKGMEIYPSVQSASEIKAAFPPLERQALSTDAIKLLTESTKGTDN